MLHAQNNSKVITGNWQGTLNAGVSLRIIIHITQQGDSLVSTLDSPDQGITGIPSTKTTLAGNAIEIEFPIIKSKYKGTVVADSNIINGLWLQGAPLPLKLKKTDAPVTFDRPQEPTLPLPYKTEEVTFENKNADSVWLSGTLSIPEGKGPFPAVVLISGSGPQNRDEFLLGHKPFYVLSDYLVRRGVIVLRYDDRGVAASTGDHNAATSADFAEDANAAVAYLRSRKDLDIDKIGLIGHSEGGLIAPLAASKNKKIDFLVLMAGTGLPGDSILKLQGDLIARAAGMPDTLVYYQNLMRSGMIEIAKRENNMDSMRAKLIAFNKTFLPTIPADILSSLGMTANDTTVAVNAYANIWMHYFLTYDPRPVLEKTKIPVLAINGTNDLQVPAAENLAAIDAALKKAGNRHYSTISFDKLNHLFQPSETGAPFEYGKIAITIDPPVLEAIGDWILQLN